MIFDTTLNLQKYAIEDHLELFGVIVHAGDAAYGHYWVFLKVDGGWFKFNDANVNEVIVNFYW